MRTQALSPSRLAAPTNSALLVALVLVLAVSLMAVMVCRTANLGGEDAASAIVVDGP